MAAVPIYVWNGTAWQETGPTIPASPIKYQTTAPTSPSTGDIWIDSDADVTSGSQQFQRFRFVASGGETSISGADANGAVLAYTAGAELVVLNGSTLVRGQDYTATNGTSITGLSPALVANDVLEVFSFIAFNVANTYTQAQVDGLIATVSAQDGMKLIVPTSAVNGTISATGAVSFSAQTSVSLNGVFSSTYDNYKVMIILTTAASAGIRFRTRVSGTDLTSSTYRHLSYYANSAANSFSALDASSSATSGSLGYGGSRSSSIEFDIFNPKLLEYTHLRAKSTFADGTNMFALDSGIVVNDLVSYDGFTIYPESSNITGTIRVYGYKN